LGVFRAASVRLQRRRRAEAHHRAHGPQQSFHAEEAVARRLKPSDQ